MREKPAPAGFLAARIRTGRYFFGGKGAPLQGVHVVGAGWEECLPDFRIERPNFRYHALEMVDSGEWAVQMGRGSEHRLRSGGIFLYGPDSQCSVRAVGAGPHGKFFLDIDGGGCRDLLRSAHLRGGMVFNAAGKSNIAALFDQLVSCSLLTRRMAAPLAAALAGAIHLRAGAERFGAPTSPPHHRNAFERCRAFLEARYTNVEGIGAAARQCNVSPEHFSRLFRRFAGMSAEKFLKRLRLNQAARLLQQSGSSIKEIALRSGFNDPYHFSKAFKAAHGVPPTVFRTEPGRRRTRKGSA
jgi:AraC-like DNA-binding protein